MRAEHWTRYCCAVVLQAVLLLCVVEARAASDSPPAGADAPAPQTKNTERTCESPPLAVTPADNVRYSVAVDTHTIWRPQGGEVTVIVTGQNNLSLSGLSLQTCFTRKSWGDKRRFI